MLEFFSCIFFLVSIGEKSIPTRDVFDELMTATRICFVLFFDSGAHWQGGGGLRRVPMPPLFGAALGGAKTLGASMTQRWRADRCQTLLGVNGMLAPQFARAHGQKKKGPLVPRQLQRRMIRQPSAVATADSAEDESWWDREQAVVRENRSFARDCRTLKESLASTMTSMSTALLVAQQL